jgi:hypothetical protein
MQFDSLDDIRALCRGLPAGDVDANEFLTDGVVVAILLLRAALACHAGAATFFRSRCFRRGHVTEPCLTACR